jgi:hypothetical protein
MKNTSPPRHQGRGEIGLEVICCSLLGEVAALSKRHALVPSLAFHRVEIID